MDISELSDMFEPFEQLIEIKVCGRPLKVPENNTILRGLQFLDLESVSEGEFCWNGECLNCQVWVKNGDKEKMIMACRTDVTAGMNIVKLGETIDAIVADIGHV